MMPKQVLEINPSHPIIVHLNSIRSSNPEYAVVVAEQVWHATPWLNPANFALKSLCTRCPV